MVDITPQYSLNITGMTPEQVQDLHKLVQFNYYKSLAEALALTLSDAMITQAMTFVTTPPQTESGIILS